MNVSEYYVEGTKINKLYTQKKCYKTVNVNLIKFLANCIEITSHGIRYGKYYHA